MIRYIMSIVISLGVLCNVSVICDLQGYQYASEVITLDKTQTSVKTQINRSEYRWFETEVTGFCDCKICCGDNAQGICADGNKPVEGITVAAPRSVPLGSVIEIEELGYYKVQDRTANRYDGRIDVYMESHKKALEFGIKKLRWRLVE